MQDGDDGDAKELDLERNHGDRLTLRLVDTAEDGECCAHRGRGRRTLVGPCEDLGACLVSVMG